MWQLITTVPRDDQLVWLYVPDSGGYLPEHGVIAAKWSGSGQDSWATHATHWMPLPLPKEPI